MVSLSKRDVPLNRMKDLVKRTSETHVEHGMLVCSSGEGSEPVRGDAIRIPPGKLEELKCPEGTERIGTFHTHPTLSEKEELIPEAYPSVKEMHRMHEKGDRMICIGSEKEINCYQTERVNGEVEDILNQQERFREEFEEFTGEDVDETTWAKFELALDMNPELENLYGDAFQEGESRLEELGKTLDKKLPELRTFHEKLSD